jgi:hypothetical protein
MSKASKKKGGFVPFKKGGKPGKKKVCGDGYSEV